MADVFIGHRMDQHEPSATPERDSLVFIYVGNMTNRISCWRNDFLAHKTDLGA